VPLNEEHKQMTDYTTSALRKDGIEDLGGCAVRAASLRSFLG
jgi:hypothetical protein